MTLYNGTECHIEKGPRLFLSDSQNAKKSEAIDSA